MKNFKEFAIESYVKAGYLDERGCSVEYLDENWRGQLWNKVGKPIATAAWNRVGRPVSNALTRQYTGEIGSELSGNENLKPSTPFTKGYDKAINTINQNSTKKNDQGQTLGRTGNSKFKKALELGSNFVPWEKVPGTIWNITKAIGGGLLGGGMQNKF
tara:strand:+ start:706 stop:1179 length:474 start_codon:yes stop_codon:yes gene_type:complete